jgi:hypothetical protein
MVEELSMHESKWNVETCGSHFLKREGGGWRGRIMEGGGGEPK